MPVDVESITDDELAVLMTAVYDEHARRRALVTAFDADPSLGVLYLENNGREEGAPYKQPTGAHNAYPLGHRVTHDGKTWVAQRDGSVGVPGESAEWGEELEEGEYPQWVQPLGSVGAYDPDVVVKHGGKLWRNGLTVVNVWEPGTPHSGWVLVEEGK